MIRYTLKCAHGHKFEAWFSSAANYDTQCAENHLSCPHCGSANVDKAIMAPSVRTTRHPGRPESGSRAKEAKDVPTAAVPVPAPAEIREAMNKFRKFVETNADYVGSNFADEARKIHYEETEPRGIYGEATKQEVKDLQEEGIDALPLPPAPEKQN